MRNITSTQTETGFTFHDGSYGSHNPCSSHLTGCWQGYIMDPAGHFILEVMRLVSQANSIINNDNHGAYFQLKNCLSDHLPKIAIDLANKFPNSGNSNINTCTTNQVQWQGWSATGSMEGYFSDAACEDFKNQFLAQATSCQSYVGAAASTVLYIVLPAAAVTALILLCACLYKNKNSPQNACREILSSIAKCCFWTASCCPDKKNNNNEHEESLYTSV